LCLYLILCGGNSVAQESSSAAAASSSQASSAPEVPLYTSTQDRDNALLTNTLTALAKKDEIEWIETPSEKVVALYKLAETRETKGVLLILHAPESPQLWPANIENLRRNLPIYGWATMTIPLPAKYPKSAPLRETTSSRDTASNASASTDSGAASSASSTDNSSSLANSSSSSAKPIIPREERIRELVDAASALLTKKGQLNVAVLVDNSCAADALATLLPKVKPSNPPSDAIDGPLQTLILLNLEDQEPLSKEQLVAIFSVSELPIMDVFFNPDSPTQREQRRNHHAEAMRQNIKDYQQVIIPTEYRITSDTPQSFWLGKVYGFLKRTADGSELSKK
jgi:hypothetical protein